MNDEARAKHYEKADEAQRRLQYIIKNRTYGGLDAELPYSRPDITELRTLKRRIKVVRDKFLEEYPPPTPPPPEGTVTKYLMFDNAKILMSLTPGDLHDLNWQFHDGFTAENYSEQSKQLALHRVNGKRHFFSCAEGADDLKIYLVPFKRVGNKFDLWELDPVEWPLMLWRLQEDMSRGIIPIMCIASGWKGLRYRNTAWHPRNNIGCHLTNRTIYMTSDHCRLLDDVDSGKIFRGVAEMLVEAMRDLKHPTGIVDPFMIEGVNEPDNEAGARLFRFYNPLFQMLEDKMKLDPTRMAFEKWNSRWIGVKKIPPHNVDPGLQDIYPGIMCFYHAENTMAGCIRWHKGEMGEIHHYYPGLCRDSDGSSKEFPGQGIVGKNWTLKFRRITPVEMQQSLIYDYKHDGAGYQHLSGVCWFESDKANFKSFMKAGVRGFTQAELKEWTAMMKAHRGVTIDLDWKLFSYEDKEGKRHPLSELMAVKRAMDNIHKQR